MDNRINKKDLHVRVNPDLYEKLRHISFYEQQTMTEVVNRLLMEFVEEKAIDEPEIAVPRVL